MSMFDTIEMDGLFLSNGPGDPEILKVTVDRLRSFMNSSSSVPPIFGICMGHALLGQALSSSIYKMK